MITKHFVLKFNHGVEIGANLAYIGHWNRTKDEKIFNIAIDEEKHQIHLEDILKNFNETPSKIIDVIFSFIGQVIMVLCAICPIWSLNLVARTMEMFAIYNYGKLALKYPEYKELFLEMQKTEELHKEYFK